MLKDYTSAYTIATRVSVFAHLGMLFSFTIKNTDFLISLRDQLKLPNVFVYGLFAMINLLPNIAYQIKKNAVAFRTRGKKVNVFNLNIVALVLIKTIYFSDAISTAMYSKGFRPDKLRTKYQVLKISPYDYVFILVCILLMICMLVIH